MEQQIFGQVLVLEQHVIDLKQQVLDMFGLEQQVSDAGQRIFGLQQFLGLEQQVFGLEQKDVSEIILFLGNKFLILS